MRKIGVSGCGISSISIKEKLQKFVFPSGLVYDKEKGAFRTPQVNIIIAAITSKIGGFPEIKKGLNSFFQAKSLSAEREGFEPSVPVSQYDSLANCSFRPLRHLSVLFFRRNANVKKDFLF